MTITEIITDTNTGRQPAEQEPAPQATLLQPLGDRAVRRERQGAEGSSRTVAFGGAADNSAGDATGGD